MLQWDYIVELVDIEKKNWTIKGTLSGQKYDMIKRGFD